MKNTILVNQKITITAEFDDRELEILMLALKLYTTQFDAPTESNRALALGMYRALDGARLQIKFCESK